MKPITKALDMLCAEGFEKIGKFLGAEIIGLHYEAEDEYLRFFTPQIISHHGGKTLTGLIGSMEMSALERWSEIERLSEHFVISLHCANFPTLMNPPNFGVSAEDDRNWCKKIVAVAHQFPTSYPQLERLIAANSEIAGVKIDRLDA